MAPSYAEPLAVLQTPHVESYLPVSIDEPQARFDSETREKKQIIASRHDSSVTISPWQVLRDAIGFADEDQRYWWDKSAKPLADLLQVTGYNIYLQYQYLLLYHRCILPALGPKPLAPGKPFWKSFCTDDHSPMEPSWTIDSSKSVVRFSMEPIGKSAGSEIDPYNQLMVKECLDWIAKAAPGQLDMEWWNYFENEFFLPAETRDIVRSRIPPNEHSTNICLALDFVGSDITTKAYFFPILKSIVTGRTGSDLVFDAIRRLHSKELGLKESLTLIEDFINEFPPETAPKLEFIAIDLVAPRDSRIKIYYRTPITAFNKVINIYTLGGRLNGPSVLAGIEVLKGLWPLVLNLPDDYPPDQELPFVPHRTTGTCFNFEIRPNDPNPQPKVYIPVRHYSKSDLEIAQSLAIFFEQQGWKDLAKTYVNDFTSVFAHNDLANTTHTHSHIGFGYKKKTGVAMTMYYAPKIFSGPAALEE